MAVKDRRYPAQVGFNRPVANRGACAEGGAWAGFYCAGVYMCRGRRIPEATCLQVTRKRAPAGGWRVVKAGEGPGIAVLPVNS